LNAAHLKILSKLAARERSVVANRKQEPKPRWLALGGRLGQNQELFVRP
jgi:hypothetical protein